MAALAYGLFSAGTARAQLPMSGAAGAFHFQADKQTFRSGGARLEGHAHIVSPQLDVTADVIVFDFTDKQISKVTARGTVKLKLDMVHQAGEQPTHVEATSNFATLDPLSRTLVLDGAVTGFYTVANGPRNTLAGTKATLHYDEAQHLIADLEGDASGIKIVLPPEDPTLPTSIGTVTITSQRATINTITGQGEFSGNAHAVSNDAVNKFDVAAPSFILTRGTSGTIDTLTTSGRTLMKFDLPPDPALAAAPPVTDAPPATVPPATAAPAPDAAKGPAIKKAQPSLKPTHFEVAADSATMVRATSTLTLDGNVKGFYLMARPDTPPTRQDFSSDRAVIKYVLPAQASTDATAGMQLDMTGKVNIAAPLEFNF